MQYIHQLHEECNCGDTEADVHVSNDRYALLLYMNVPKICSNR
jgi:hypothetical protein